ADSVVGYILGWFLLSMLVGVFAGTRGRNIAGWSLVALLTSPLIAFVILVATPDFAAQERERHERSAANEAATAAGSRRVQGADIAIRFEKLRQLRDKDLLTAGEYIVRKQKVIDELEGKRLVESGEEFL